MSRVTSRVPPSRRASSSSAAESAAPSTRRQRPGFEWRLVGAQLRDAIRKYDENYKNPDIKSQFGGDSWAGAAWQFEMIAESPIFQPVCFTMGHCPWKAGYDRGCTIRDRVDQGKFDDIKTEEWLADPSAAWVT